MKRYEKEAFTKSLILFFGVEIIFLSIVMWQHYKSISHQYDMHIMYEMRECLYSNQCKNYQVDRYSVSSELIEHLYHKDSRVYMIFKDKDGFIKISIPHNIYHKKIKEFRIMVLKESLVYSLMLLLISILFAYYTIYPLKKALQINEEFIKDILHDLNTPLTSLKINLKILQKKFGDNPIITRADNSISTIVDMQSNLKYFLVNSALQQEEFSLEDVLTKKADYYQSIFVKLSFKLDIQEDSKIICNKEAFIRIVDNIISNASKYNIDNGYVLISYRDKILTISDNGVGIKEPKRIFDRYYKESSSGIGIGLHIVKKLCDELNIAITLKTDLNIGSKFILDISGVVKD